MYLINNWYTKSNFNSSLHHEGGDSKGGSGTCKLFSTGDACELPCSCCGPRCSQWESWCNVAPFLGCSSLAGLDGHDCTTDFALSSTTAIGNHILAWSNTSRSVGTKRWSFFTSSTNFTSLWNYLSSNELLNGDDLVLSSLLILCKLLNVAVICGFFANNNCVGVFLGGSVNFSLF